MKARAFSAQHNAKIEIVILRVVGLRSPLIQAKNPDILRLQFLEAAGNISHPRNRQMLDGAGSRFRYRGRDADGAAFGNDYAIGPGAFRGAYNRAEVVRIFHSVQHKHKPVPSSGPLEKIAHVGVLVLRDDRGHSLVGCTVRQAVDVFPRHEAHSDPRRTAFIDDLLEFGVLAAPGNRDMLNGPATRRNCLPDGVDSVNNLHSQQCTRQLKFCLVAADPC